MSHSPLPAELNRNRFPNLFEVLSRKTVAPLDLFSFYIYMRDQQRSVDYLDFWYVILRTRSKEFILTQPGLTCPNTFSYADCTCAASTDP
jgi:hypothetical protein